jgi:hypothetical protein
MTIMLNQFIIRSLFCVLIGGIGIVMSACAEDKTTKAEDGAVEPASELTLDKSDGDRVLNQDGQIGPRDTTLFYPYYEKRAVVMIRIGNSDNTFPTRGTVTLFPPTTTREGIDKWINNAHSDGLFIDPAKPSETITLPADIFQVKALDIIGQGSSTIDEQQVFDNHRVKLSMKKYHVAGKFTLSAIEDEARVFLKKP